MRARSGRSSALGRRGGSAAGAPTAAGDAAAASVGRWREVAVELALVTVVGPVQQLLLPGLVEQQQTFVQFDLGRVERAQARQQPPPGVRDARGGAALGGVALGPVFEFGRHATKRRARAASATPADMPGSRDPASMLRDVVVILGTEVHPFELGTLCEVFGLDRSEDGLPGFEFAVCAPDPTPRVSAGGLTVTPSPTGDLTQALPWRSGTERTHLDGPAPSCAEAAGAAPRASSLPGSGRRRESRESEALNPAPSDRRTYGA